VFAPKPQLVVASLTHIFAVGAGFALPEAWDKCEWPYNHIILGKIKKFFLEQNEDILKVDSIVSWSHFLLKIIN
jgi:hypothetical protein